MSIDAFSKIVTLNLKYSNTFILNFINQKKKNCPSFFNYL